MTNKYGNLDIIQDEFKYFMKRQEIIGIYNQKKHIDQFYIYSYSLDKRNSKEELWTLTADTL